MLCFLSRYHGAASGENVDLMCLEFGQKHCEHVFERREARSKLVLKTAILSSVRIDFIIPTKEQHSQGDLCLTWS